MVYTSTHVLFFADTCKIELMQEEKIKAFPIFHPVNHYVVVTTSVYHAFLYCRSWKDKNSISMTHLKMNLGKN